MTIRERVPPPLANGNAASCCFCRDQGGDSTWHSLGCEAFRAAAFALLSGLFSDIFPGTAAEVLAAAIHPSEALLTTIIVFCDILHFVATNARGTDFSGGSELRLHVALRRRPLPGGGIPHDS